MPLFSSHLMQDSLAGSFRPSVAGLISTDDTWAEGFYDSTIHVFFRKKLDLEEQAIRTVQSFLWERGIDRSKAHIRSVLNSEWVRVLSGCCAVM
jgi:hypothetical protein